MKLFGVPAAAVVSLALAGAAVAAPVSGSVFGPIVSVTGKSLKLTTPLSPTGSSIVSIGSSTTITEQVAATRSSVHAGVCVSAVGTRAASGVVSAQRLTVSQPTQGKCTGGFGGRGRPGGRPQGLGQGSAPPTNPGGPGGRGNGNFGGNSGFGFASGGVTSVSGDTFTVQTKRGGSTTKTTVTISKQTSFTEVEHVGAAAVKTKLCAFIYGTSADGGKTVSAQTISLTTPTSNGCTGGFRRPGG